MGDSAVSCTIAVDTMGGDRGPTEFIRGLFHAVEVLKLDCNFVLAGKQRLLEKLVKVRNLNTYKNRIDFCNSTQVIEMNEKPVQALKNKKDSSMVNALGLLKDHRVDAVVSCGNTGALMAGSTLKLRQIPGVDRPALGIIVPGKINPFVLIDVGANPESTSKNLVHNAILGANYAKAALGLEQPRIALLTIGTEEGKGNSLINETHSLLQKIDNIIRYIGPIEGFQLFDNIADVVVCDGFVGNIVLKSSEAVFSFVSSTMREELVRNVKRKIGAALSKSAFKDVKTRLGPDRHAGAPLLGLRGNVLKTHGSSNYIAIANALRIAKEIITHDMIHFIERDITQANTQITKADTEKPCNS